MKNLDASWGSLASKGLDDIVQTLNLQIAEHLIIFSRVMGISEQLTALWSPYAVSSCCHETSRFSKRLITYLGCSTQMCKQSCPLASPNRPLTQVLVSVGGFTEDWGGRREFHCSIRRDTPRSIRQSCFSAFRPPLHCSSYLLYFPFIPEFLHIFNMEY